MRSPFVVAAAVVTAAALLSSAAAAADDNYFDLVLLHANDMHSRFDETDVYGNECRENDAELGKCYGGFARIAAVVREEKLNASRRGVPSLFMVAGDSFQGTPYFSFYKWRPVVDFVKQLRPDIMTLGNHEFDDGIQSLVSYLNGIQDIPTVVSNLNMTSESELNKLVLSSYIFSINNTSVGVVGYLTTDTPSISNTGAVEFFDEIVSLKRETKKLREKGVNIIIGLGHSGIEKDIIIAKEVEEIDLIVGGHSHTFLYTGTPPSIEKPHGTYPFYVTNAKNKTVPILQAYANTKYIGKVNLRFDSNGDLVNIDGFPILLNNKIQQDLDMLKMVDKWKPKLTEITNITIGRTAVVLKNSCHQEECNIGNLIADSFVYYNLIQNSTFNEHWTDAPIGLIQSGGIRSSINETEHDGYITLGQLITVIPFANRLVKITVTGSSLLEVFENSVSNYVIGSGGGRFLQVSGVRVKYDLTKSPGHRVTSLFVRCGNCSIPNFEPLVLTANYTLVTNDFLARGGDNYQSLKKIIKPNTFLGIEDFNATVVYTKSIGLITTGVEGRVSFQSGNDEKSTASIKNTTNFQLVLIVFAILLFFNF